MCSINIKATFASAGQGGRAETHCMCGVVGTHDAGDDDREGGDMRSRK